MSTSQVSGSWHEQGRSVQHAERTHTHRSYTMSARDGRGSTYHNPTYQMLDPIQPMAVDIKKHITVWRPSVCLFNRHTHRDSPGDNMRRSQRTFQADNKEDRHTCYRPFRYSTKRKYVKFS